MIRAFIMSILVAGLGYCAKVHATVDNVIAMSYATMSIYQNIVLSSAEKSGGTFTLSVQAKDGGGRGPPNFPSDVANLTMKYYNSSGTLLATSTSNNSTTYGESTYRTYTLTSPNCGGSCANVYYVQISFTGNDGGYWSGNVGTNFMAPVLTFTPTGSATPTAANLLYNPEFGVYGTYTSTSGPQGWWNTTNAWGGNTHPQLVNNGATVNTDAGGYLVQGGTLSGTVGGYPSTAVTYTSSITATQQSTYTASQTKVTATTGNSIYIDQVGSNNTITITQVGTKNKVAGTGQQSAPIVGDGNTVTVRQGDPSGTTTRANVTEFGIYGSYNTVNLNQGTDSQGAGTGQDVGGHYIYNYVNGSNNSVTASQQNTTTSTAGQFLSNTVNGNSNTQNFVQSGAGGHQIFSAVTGDSNTMSVTQSGNGGHYLQVTEYGNGNDAQVTQSGNTKNNATINLTNNGAPASVTLQQSGGAVYNIDRTCTTTCGRVTVSQ
jgi:hypothetical protein